MATQPKGWPYYAKAARATALDEAASIERKAVRAINALNDRRGPNLHTIKMILPDIGWCAANVKAVLNSIPVEEPKMAETDTECLRSFLEALLELIRCDTPHSALDKVIQAKLKEME